MVASYKQSYSGHLPSYSEGIRLQGKSPYNFDIARAITYGKYKRSKVTDNDLCHIYAFAFGRPDDGTTMEESEKIGNAFKKGASENPLRKGSIYVVGAGNGKTTGDDNCAADDLANDPHTLVIASADYRGKVTPYSERCAAVMATAYSSDDSLLDDEAVVTVTGAGVCTSKYTGNYPSVGIAAGIIALVLQSKSLTLRDIQHLIAMTSEVAPLADNPGTWTKNKAGFYISNDFGFGLLNAENMVNMAEKWITVPPMTTAEATFNFEQGKTILKPGELISGTARFDSLIAFMETVELIATVRLVHRGSIKLVLESACGTKVVMMEPRPRDRSSSSLKNWSIKTSHFWGEHPKGRWTLTASIEKFPEEPSSCLSGLYRYLEQRVPGKSPNEITKIKLVVHGTQKKPVHYPEEPEDKRKYSDFVL